MSQIRVNKVYPSGSNLTLSASGQIDVSGTVNVTGALNVYGTTTTIDTVNLTVEDPLIVLSKNASGGASVDSGLIVERGSDANVGMIWDESADQFATINTSEAGSTAGNVTISSYAGFRAGAVTSDSLVVDTTTLVVDASNNRVGIGVAAPDSLLDLKGSGADGNELLRFSLDGDRDWSFAQEGSGAGTGLRLRSLAAKDFHLDSSTHIFRDENGSNEIVRMVPSTSRVGINDNNPAHTLDVNGDINLTGDLSFDDSATVVSSILDEDNMASNSATALATQQSIKAYVDSTAGSTAADDISAGDNTVNLTTSSGNITVDSNAGTVTVDGHTGVTITSSDSGVVEVTSAANVDINATTGVTIDGTTISIDGTDDVNLTVTSSTAGEDLTIQQIGANDSSIIITAAGTGTDAVSIDATAGDMLIAPSLADEKTLKIGKNGAVEMVFSPHGTAASEKFLLTNTAGTADDAIKLTSVAGGVTIHAGNDSLHIDADGTDADALNIDSAGGIDIDAAGAVAINSAAATNLTMATNTAATVTMTIAATNADGSNVANIDVDADGTVYIDGGVGINIGTNVDKPIDIDSTTLDIDASGAISIDGAGIALAGGANASSFNVATGGADAKDLTLSVTGGGDSSLILSSAGTGADAVSIDASAGSMVIGSSLADGQTLKLGKNGAVEMVFTPHGTPANEKFSVTNTAGTADDAIKLHAVAGGVTIQAGNDSLHIDADGTDADALNIDSAGGIDIDAAGAVAIDGAGIALAGGANASSFNVATGGADAKDLTLSVTGGGDSSLLLTSAGTGTDALSLDVTAGDMKIAPSLADGKTLVIGKNGAVEMTFTPHGTPASEKWSIVNTAGTAADAIKIEAAGGGITLKGGDQNDSIYLENSALEFEQISAPTSTTNKLYNVGGTLTFNGTALGSGGASALNDLSDVNYAGGNLTITSLDTLTFSTTASTITMADASGTDQAANNLTIQAGAGTGTGAGGSIKFEVAGAAGGSGSGANSHAAALTIGQDKTAEFESAVKMKGIFTLGADLNEFTITESSDDITLKNSVSDKDIIFNINDGGTPTEVARFDGSAGSFLMAGTKKIE